MANEDRELQALRTIMRELYALSREGRWRVINYMRERFSAEDSVNPGTPSEG